MRLKDKAVIVTGGGPGEGISLCLAKEGSHRAASGVKPDSAERVAARVKKGAAKGRRLTMKKALLVMSLIFTMISAGCLSVETTVKVNPDGSGQIIEKIGLGKYLTSLASGIAGDTDKKQEPKLLSRETFENGAAEFGEGVTFVSMSESEDENMKYFRAVYAFKDINDVTIDQNQQNRVSFENDGSGQMKAKAGQPGLFTQAAKKKKETLQFSFSKGEKYSTLNIKLPAMEADKKEGAEASPKAVPKETAPEMVETQLAMFKMMFKDLRFATKIECNGEVIKTNATNVEGNTITLWDIDFGKVIDNTEKVKELGVRGPEDIEGLKEVLKDVEGIKFELERDISIQFK